MVVKPEIKLHNSLTQHLEIFTSLTEGHVDMYTCGPTVYDYPTIGNWRTYLTSDTLARLLKYLDYDVTHVMNITDVGHLTGDNIGDASSGEDRLEKAAQKEQKTAWDIAEFYARDFVHSFSRINIVMPEVLPRATEHIDEQIKLIQKIEARGFAYTIADGVYFDVTAYEAAGNEYGKLSNLDAIKEGARVEINLNKKDPRDFALWKFSPSEEKRQMEWDSPWGMGFPGWHIECSAMSMKYLGETFDIHLGGEDLRSTHHPNEIAQSESATEKIPFARYWLHTKFLLIDGGKMGKSLGNAYTLHDIESRGFSPLDYRYLVLTSHYRSPLDFTWQSLEAAQTARERLNRIVIENEPTDINYEVVQRIVENIANDLGTPQAIAGLWEYTKSESDKGKVSATLKEIDKLLGLNLGTQHLRVAEISDEVKTLLEERRVARENKDWTKSDLLRTKINKAGFHVEDTEEGQHVRPL